MRTKSEQSQGYVFQTIGKNGRKKRRTQNNNYNKEPGRGKKNTKVVAQARHQHRKMKELKSGPTYRMIHVTAKENLAIQ
jgi:hypothetical protein